MRPLQSTALTAASLLLALTNNPASAASPKGAIAFDDFLTLQRGPDIDEVSYDLVAPVTGTCIAIVDEDDVDLQLELIAARNGAAPAKAAFESGFLGEGVEVGTIPVTRGAKLTVHLTSPPEMPKPTRVRTRVECYASDSKSPEALARVPAYRAWGEVAATDNSASEEAIDKSKKVFDEIIARLRGPGGDPRMVPWAYATKGQLYGGSAQNLLAGLEIFKVAEKEFAALDPPDPRNVARAQFMQMGWTADLINGGATTNPTPQEARIQSFAMAEKLAAATSPLSAVEKTRAIKFQGYICFQVSDYACAIRIFEIAAAAAKANGHKSDQLSLRYNLAATQSDLGNTAKAAQEYDEILPLVTLKSVNRQRYSTINFGAGITYSSTGDTVKATECMMRVLESARESGSALELGRAMYGLGFIYWQRGDYQQSEVFHRESLKQRRLASDPSGLALSLAMVARFERMNGNYDEALKLHREARERSTSPSTITASDYELALDAAAAGHFDQAIEFARQGMADAGERIPGRRMYAQLQVAQFIVARPPSAAELAESQKLANEVLKFGLQNSEVFLELGARHVIAKGLAIQGDYTGARREYEGAIGANFDFRGATSSPELQASTLAHEQETFREYIDLLMRGAVARGAHRFAPASRDEEDALRALELARSSNSAPPRDVALDAATQARIDSLLQQLAAKRVRIQSLMDRGPAGAKALAAVQLDMARIRAEVDGLRGGAGGDARTPKLPAAVRRPWPAVPAGVTQLSYALGKSHAYLWVRDASGLRVAVLAATPASLEKSFATVGAIDLNSDPGKLDVVLADLSRSLLMPGVLPKDGGSIEVVAEGALATVPFAALHAPGSGRRLVETRAVRMITSMFDTRAAAPGKPRALRFAAVTSGTGKMRSAAHVFPALSATRAEAREIAALFGQGGDATRIRLLTAADGDTDAVRALWVGGADVVHFATHGLANLRYPSASLLLLPKGGGEEAAYLTAGQVQEWRGDSELVFLAACETAAGPGRFAEGMSGLPRSFLNAGARGIVATLWPVEDIYESEFSVAFYQRFIESRDAESALALTQRAWLAPRPGERASERQRRLATAWAHVLYAKPK